MTGYKILKLGSGVNLLNDIVIPDQAISQEHLFITFVDKDHICIEDLFTSNGTRVNGTYLKKATISRDDDIQLGQSTWKGDQIFRKCYEQWNKVRIVFHEEFKEVVKEYQLYETDKNKLKNKFKTYSLLLKVTVTASLIVLGITLGKKLGWDTSLTIVISSLSAAIGYYISDMVFGQDKLNNQLRDLAESRKSTIICPKCSRKLQVIPFKTILKLKRCENCDASWQA